MSRSVHHFIIAYDISCPKRLQKVYRKLCGHAMRLQYSVFYFVGTLSQYQACIDEIVPLIHLKKDDLRAYPLPTNGYQWRFGKATLPEGIHYTGLPRAWTDLDLNHETPASAPVVEPKPVLNKPVLENNAYFIV
jgi:CRISPR-associated protein Cas2